MVFGINRPVVELYYTSLIFSTDRIDNINTVYLYCCLPRIVYGSTPTVRYDKYWSLIVV